MNAPFSALCASLAAVAGADAAPAAHQLAWLSLVALVLLPLLLPLIDAWWLARRSALGGAPIPMLGIVIMRLRRINPAAIIRAQHAAGAAGILIPLAALQAHVLTRANVERTVQALCTAKAAGIPLSFERACAIERCGHDAGMAVAGAITPHAILFGDALPSGDAISASTGDGVRLSAGGSATVRCCLERLVGGAGEDVLRARLGMAISELIAGTSDAGALLGDPAALERALLAARLDAQTAFHLDGVAITLRRTGMDALAPHPGGHPS